MRQAASSVPRAPMRANGVGASTRTVMAIVISGGDVQAGDAIAVELPAGERHPLVPV